VNMSLDLLAFNYILDDVNGLSPFYDLIRPFITGKVSDPESLLFYVGFYSPGRLTP